MLLCPSLCTGFNTDLNTITDVPVSGRYNHRTKTRFSPWTIFSQGTFCCILLTCYKIIYNFTFSKNISLLDKDVIKSWKDSWLPINSKSSHSNWVLGPIGLTLDPSLKAAQISLHSYFFWIIWKSISANTLLLSCSIRDSMVLCYLPWIPIMKIWIFMKLTLIAFHGGTITVYLHLYVPFVSSRFISFGSVWCLISSKTSFC